jgi:hypothetical protein
VKKLSPQTKLTLRVALCVLIVTSAGISNGQTFTRQRSQIQVGPKPTAILIEDLDGDGIRDIVTSDAGDLRAPSEEKPANNELSLLIGGGNATYTAQPPLRTGFAPYCLAAGNIDNRPGIDLIAGCFMANDENDLTFLRNIGLAHFESIGFGVRDDTVPYTKMTDGDEQPIFTTPGVTSVALGEFDGDGLVDLVGTGWSSDVILIWPGNAETVFGEPRAIHTTGGPRDVKAHDFDGDSVLDLAVLHYSSAQVSLWKGNGRGGFEQKSRLASRGPLPTRLVVNDLNMDGRLDLAATHCYTSDSIVVFYGEGTWDFSVSQEISLGVNPGTIEQEIRDFVVAPLNADERPDIAVACFGSGKTVVLLNASSDTSVPQRYNQESYSFEGGRPRALYAADVNDDSSTDLAIALWGTNSVAFLLGKAIEAPAKKTPKSEH